MSWGLRWCSDLGGNRSLIDLWGSLCPGVEKSPSEDKLPQRSIELENKSPQRSTELYILTRGVYLCGNVQNADAHLRRRIKAIIAGKLRKRSRITLLRRTKISAASFKACGKCSSAACPAQRKSQQPARRNGKDIMVDADILERPEYHSLCCTEKAYRPVSGSGSSGVLCRKA